MLKGRPLLRFLSLLALAAAVFVVAASSASAETREEKVANVPLRDGLQRAEKPLSAGGDWAALAWAGDSPTAGVDSISGWHSSAAFPAVAGAYWTPETFAISDSVWAQVNATPGSLGRYGALWLDMPAPASEETGFQLSWTYEGFFESKNRYDVALSRWSSGTQTVLRSGSFSFADGSRVALDHGPDGVVAPNTVEFLLAEPGKAFKGMFEEFTSSTTAGYAGIEASGNLGRITAFHAGEHP
jgi:hypothetical protein